MFVVGFSLTSPVVYAFTETPDVALYLLSHLSVMFEILPFFWHAIKNEFHG